MQLSASQVALALNEQPQLRDGAFTVTRAVGLNVLVPLVTFKSFMTPQGHRRLRLEEPHLAPFVVLDAYSRARRRGSVHSNAS